MNALTVLGPVPAEALGITLPHEHLVFDFRDYFEPPTTPAGWQLAQLPVSLEVLGSLHFDPFLLLDNMLHNDVDLTVQELREFVALGGRTVVDPTNVSIGRDPLALQAIAQATGLNIIMGAGHYFEISLGDPFRARTLDSITEEIVRDVTVGVNGTDIRAGLIGEIGTSSPITENEEKSLRASARAQAQTGAPLMIHLNGWEREGEKVLDIIEEEGGELTKTILCHMNPSWMDLDYQRRLGERGAYLEYDMMGMTYEYPPNKLCPDDSVTVGAIKQLIDDGFLERILMSQDVFLKSQFRRYGGVGFTHIFTTLRKQYERLGVRESELTTIFKQNPQRVLAFL